MSKDPGADKAGDSNDAKLSVKASDAYHHGDLRAALIAAAREALETAAPEDITLKSLALRLGVSQPAPYRHFNNRDALLAAVAADGFARFGQAIGQAVEAGDPKKSCENACLAYLAFGRANRGVYRLMFASRIVFSNGDERLANASTATFGMLLQDISQYLPTDRVGPIAVWVWSTLHGMAMLEGDGLVSGPRRDIDPTLVIREMVETLGLQG